MASGGSYLVLGLLLFVMLSAPKTWAREMKAGTEVREYLKIMSGEEPKMVVEIIGGDEDPIIRSLGDEDPIIRSEVINENNNNLKCKKKGEVCIMKKECCSKMCASWSWEPAKCVY